MRKQRVEPTMKHVILFTDGACIGNPGPGGYGAVLKYDKHRKELFGGVRKTTNNRMELLAAIAGLEAIKYRCKVTLYSDSKYVVNGISKGWARRWKANGWMRTKTAPALNGDLWDRLLSLTQKHDVTFKWVRGHSGNRENEICDRLATKAAQGNSLTIDKEYENQFATPLFDDEWF